MELLAFLIVFPLVAAILLLAIRADKARSAITVVSAAVIAIASIVLAVTHAGQSWIGYAVPASAVGVIDIVALCIGIALAGIVIGFAVKYKSTPALILAIVQLAGSLYFELACAHGIEVMQPLYIDTLSVIMALIIGIIGSGICVYALGYMRDFQAHEPEGAKDRRPVFFALMFLFLAAMYVIVFSNNMSWMFTGWEITTTCSFLLIAYTRTDEAIRNAFRQIIMNILGGIGFLAALIISSTTLGTLSFNEFIAIGVESAGAASGLLVFAVCALAFAGLTKAAQMPFHTWLLGAMVAPTPTSALLHSSTMVKAGVFLIIKLSPILATTGFVLPRSMVLLIGGITFMLCSFMAISQSNAKRVLAYSTIANLGLIVACAGIGTTASLWAAILLTIFHAAAKSLLFLCVGTAEHHIGSRNIEDMDLLFERMPRLSRFMMLGIMCMFIAPFGMLTAKWATLASFAAAGNVVLIILLVFGSAATFMFWAKWLGKLTGIAGNPENVEKTVHPSEWASLTVMAAIALLACVLLPLVSHILVVPAIQGTIGMIGSIPTGPLSWSEAASLGILSDDELWISAVLAILGFVTVFGSSRAAKKRTANVYLSGVSIDSDTRTYRNSLGEGTQATARNMYLEPWFGENRFTKLGVVVCSVIIIAALVASIAAPALGSPRIYGFIEQSHVSIPITIVGSIVFAIVAPIIGCLLAGLERKISARMQGRVGPPILQPYYDVRKLLGKEDVSVSGTDGLYLTCALIFTAVAGGIFFTGGNLLMSAFVITMASLLFIMAAASTRSPYAEVGAAREILQIMSYEPMVLLMSVAFMLATGVACVSGAFDNAVPAIATAWLAFIGLLFVLTIKLRKSPFDLSYAHHAHQDLVKGITTEMSGRTLAKVEIMHWAETVLFLGWVGVFFVWSNPLSIIIGVVVALAAWFLEIWIDNNFARMKWQAMVKSAWIVALVCGGINIALLIYLPVIF